MMTTRGHQPRGIDVVLLELAHELTRAGDAVPFLFDPFRGDLIEAPKDWFDLARLYQHSKWSSPGAAPRRRKFARPGFFKPAAAKGTRLTPDQGDDIISFGRPEMILSLLRRHPNLRHSVMIHDVSMASGKFVRAARLTAKLRKATRDMCARADRVFVPSHLTQENLAALNGHYAEVLPLAHDFRKVQPVAVPNLPPSYFLHVGPLKFWKNGAHLLKAHGMARAKRPDLPDLVVAGRTGGKARPGVIYVGNPTHGELQFIYENCCGLVLPSRSEGFALPMGEALSFGKPIIFNEALTALCPPSDGFVRSFDGDDVDQISKAMLALADAFSGGAALTTPRLWGDVARDLCALVPSAGPDAACKNDSQSQFDPG